MHMKDKGNNPKPRKLRVTRRRSDLVVVPRDINGIDMSRRAKRPVRPGFKIPKVPQYRVPGNKNSWTWLNPAKNKKARHKR
jgi:hypothetical protein